MSEMKTITINGNTYTIDDPDAVSYTAQNDKTDEEKAVARENIGAVGADEYQQFHQDTTEDLNATVKTVAQNLGDASKKQARKNIDAAHIDDSKVAEDETWSSQKISDTINDKTLLVTYDEQGDRTNYKAADIYNHVATTGGTVVLLYQNDYFTLARATESYAKFSYCGETDDAVYNIYITRDGTLLYGKELVTSETLEATEKGIIDKLCPSFTESGSVVSCHPLEGYPLSVVSQIQPVQEGEGDPRPAQWVELTETNVAFSGSIELMQSNGEALIEGKTYRFVSNAKSSSGEIVPLATAEVWDAEGGYMSPIPCVVKDNYVEFTMFAEDVDGEKTSSHVDIRLTYHGTVDKSTVYTESELSGEITLLPGVFVFQEYDPGNIRPITGHSEIKLWCDGKNLLPYPYVDSSKTTNEGVTYTDNGDGTITLNGTPTSVGGNTFTLATHVELKDGVEYFLNDGTEERNVTVYIQYLDESGTKQWHSKYKTPSSLVWNKNYTLQKVYIQLNEIKTFNNVIISPQLEVGSTATPYEPYRGEAFTIDLGQTVYGGSYNWQTGELVIDRKLVTLDGTEVWRVSDTQTANKKQYQLARALNRNLMGDVSAVSSSRVTDTQLLCSKFPTVRADDTYLNREGIGIFTHPSDILLYIYCEQYTDGNEDGFKEMMKGAQIVFGLAEPITEQFTPQEILALSGENTLYSDTGDTQVSGKADPSAIIADLYTKINALQTAAVNNA